MEVDPTVVDVKLGHAAIRRYDNQPPPVPCNLCAGIPIPNLTSTYLGLSPVLHCVLIVKMLVGDFKQEKALVLVGAISMIVKSSRTFV